MRSSSGEIHLFSSRRLYNSRQILALFKEKMYHLKEMHRVVNALPREYKIPFSMHVSGFKYREIAEKLGLPLGTVKSRIFFTRQKLQQELKDFR